jgi:ArsR family transcriptional regulator
VNTYVLAEGGIDMEELADIANDLKLLGDKTRLIMLSLLKEREWCVCEFVEIFDISQPAISQHLRKLKDQGLVREDKRGQWVHYSLNVNDKPYIQAVLDHMPDSRTILSILNKELIVIECK